MQDSSASAVVQMPGSGSASAPSCALCVELTEGTLVFAVMGAEAGQGV
jgi:hypothetical protein